MVVENVETNCMQGTASLMEPKANYCLKNPHVKENQQVSIFTLHNSDFKCFIFTCSIMDTFSPLNQFKERFHFVDLTRTSVNLLYIGKIGEIDSLTAKVTKNIWRRVKYYYWKKYYWLKGCFLPVDVSPKLILCSILFQEELKEIYGQKKNDIAEVHVTI